MNTIRLLQPAWSSVGTVTYQITHEDYFSFQDTIRPTLSSHYSLSLTWKDRCESGAIFNAKWHEGIWGAIKHKQGIADVRSVFFDVENKLSFDCDFIVDQKGEFSGPLSPESFDSSVKEHFLQYLTDVSEFQKAKAERELPGLIDDMSSMLFQDVQLILENIGNELLEEGFYEQIKITPEEYILEENIHRDLNQYIFYSYKLTNNVYHVERLRCLNMQTSDVDNCFKSIQADFNAGDFNVDNHSDVTLNHTIFLIDMDTLLVQGYSYAQNQKSNLFHKQKRIKVRRTDIG